MNKPVRVKYDHDMAKPDWMCEECFEKEREDGPKAGRVQMLRLPDVHDPDKDPLLCPPALSLSSR